MAFGVYLLNARDGAVLLFICIKIFEIFSYFSCQSKVNVCFLSTCIPIETYYVPQIFYYPFEDTWDPVCRTTPWTSRILFRHSKISNTGYCRNAQISHYIFCCVRISGALFLLLYPWRLSRRRFAIVNFSKTLRHRNELSRTLEWSWDWKRELSIWRLIKEY